MQFKYLLKPLLCLLFLLPTIFSLAECGSGRYYDKVFSSAVVTKDIDYGGWRKNLESGRTRLLLDLYEPYGDTESERPLFILIHGGAFLDFPIIDKRSPDILNMAQDLVQRGYVCASPEYRLIKNPLSLIDVNIMAKEVVVSMLDVNDALCFFAESYYNGNPYRIDPNRVFVAGVSAGALITLHGVFVDRIDELGEPYITAARAVEQLDGINIQETLDNKYCGIKGLGAVSISGALIDTSLIKYSETVLLFSHGTEDNIVPINIARPFGISTLPNMYGPQAIVPKLLANGTHVEYDEWVGSWHVPFLAFNWEDILSGQLREFLIDDYKFDSTMNHIARFAQKLMGCPTGIRDNTNAIIRLYPNPGKGKLYADIPLALRNSPLLTEVINTLGQKVFKEEYPVGTTKIAISGLPSGQLYISIADAKDSGNTLFTGKIIVQ